MYSYLSLNSPGNDFFLHSFSDLKMAHGTKEFLSATGNKTNIFSRKRLFIDGPIELLVSLALEALRPGCFSSTESLNPRLRGSGRLSSNTHSPDNSE